jgi:hypothetical protein
MSLDLGIVPLRPNRLRLFGIRIVALIAFAVVIQLDNEAG